MIFTTSLQLLLLNMPRLAKSLGTLPLAIDNLLVCVRASLIYVVYLKTEKVLHQCWSRQRTDAHSANSRRGLRWQG